MVDARIIDEIVIWRNEWFCPILIGRGRLWIIFYLLFDLMFEDEFKRTARRKLTELIYLISTDFAPAVVVIKNNVEILFLQYQLNEH